MQTASFQRCSVGDSIIWHYSLAFFNARFAGIILRFWNLNFKKCDAKHFRKKHILSLVVDCFEASPVLL